MTFIHPQRLLRLLTADTRNISRDPTLMFAICLNLIAPIAFLIWQTHIDSAAFKTFGIPEFHRYLVPTILILPAVLVGLVTGFLLLDDRDDGPLIALDVTPMGKAGFFGYRASVTALVTFIMVLATGLAITPKTGILMLVFIAFLTAIEAVSAAFILLALARNKVEGLALTKVINFALLVPFLVFIPSPWRLLAGIIPSYWIAELLEISATHYLPMHAVFVATIFVHVTAVAMLYRMAVQKIG